MNNHRTLKENYFELIFRGMLIINIETLRNAKIRSGKSVRTDGVGYLQKGSVVVINQIKGRSGRVVHPQRNGEFIKVGWVTLYTHDGQQLLEKVTCKRTMMRNKA